MMRKLNVRKLALAALFIALTLLLGLTPLGLIPLGVINVTILCVPVIIGTIVMGLKTGIGLGACFGLASTLSAFGFSMTPPSTLASTLLAASPLMAIAVCFIPRLLVPVVTNAVYRLIAWQQGRETLGLPIAAAAGSLTNTVCYLGLMYLAYVILGLDSALVLGILAMGTVAGMCEAFVAAVVATPVTVALWKLERPR